MLDDACDLSDFKVRKSKVKFEYCYVGSLLKEKVWKNHELASYFPQKRFHVFDTKTIDPNFNKLQIKELKNLYMHNFKAISLSLIF